MFRRKEIIDFDKVFKGENYTDYIEKLKTLPKKLLLKASTFLLGFHHSDSFVHSHYELLSMWFGKENNKIANEINDIINKYIKTSGHEIVIINPRSSLVLFENILSVKDTPNTVTESDFELLLFKVYLALNQNLMRMTT
ncbi:hypothetical protein LA303_07905 [Candidatus Sulfidibacterium hydrothermale]|uniref:hypothetical protein n=1 Tax=Candidatus Sulfidibacterium hydrothermale TaxID=2875962 RepID=UPI001F0B2B84|nr:hypothetical protein [Candidatus Sulfidibacterium hydrothermale]UBM61347.1 hypothetical protein LA303_07905 [Candidatus Sulfidibacterium hydrothermale]